jgi:hypothetical protein
MTPLKPPTQIIVIRNTIPDYLIIVSLTEPAPGRFRVTFSRESLADQTEVIEEWFLKKGQHCTLEFEDDEVVENIDDRLRLSLGLDAAIDGKVTSSVITIVGFQN